MGVHSEEAVRRLLTRLREENGCLVYTGQRNDRGYGRIKTGGVDMYTHRMAKEIELGRRLQRDEVVMHVCDNPPCCKPEHLFIGTLQANNLDMREKGRTRAKLLPSEVLEIRLRLTYNHSLDSIALSYQVSTFAIKQIKDGKTYKNIQLTQKSLYDPFADDE